MLRHPSRLLLVTVVVAALVGVVLPASPVAAATGDIDTLVGPADLADFHAGGLAVSATGDLYIADPSGHRVVRRSPAGVVSVVAGTGVPGFSGDGGPATASQLSTPTDVVLDPAGNLYIADLGNNRIRRVDTGGTISTYAGTGQLGPPIDGALALESPFVFLADLLWQVDALVAVDGAAVVRIDATQHVEVLVDGSFGTPMSSAAVTPSGDLLVGYQNAGAVRRFDPDGAFLADVVRWSPDAAYADGGSALDTDVIGSFSIEALGEDAVALGSPELNRIIVVTPEGVTTTLAGPTQGFSGDGGPASSAAIDGPGPLVLDAAGDLVFSDVGNDRVRRIELPDAPGAPTSVVAAPGDGAVTVTWAPPVDDGGSPVRTYAVTLEPGGQGCVWTAGPTSCTIEGLVPTKAYAVTVRALNGVSFGPASAPEPFVAGGTVDRFAGIVPVRVLDTRDGTGSPAAPIAKGETRDVAVADGSGPVPATATAVVLNLTAVQPTTLGGHLTVWAAGTPMPGSSNLNFSFHAPAGTARANLVVAEVGIGGAISIRAEVEPSVEVIADLVGWFGPTGTAGYASVVPARVVDSRLGLGTAPGPLGPGAVRTVTLAGVAGVPASATGVVVNVTSTGATAATHLTVWPDGAPLPPTSTLNVRAGETAANAAIVAPGPGGAVQIRNNSGFAHVIIDVVGYLDPSVAAGFVPITPTRALDGRAPGFMAAGVLQDVAVAVGSPAPSDAEGLVMNLTGIGPTAATHLTVWPAGSAMPPTSTLNLVSDDIRANAAIGAPGVGGAVSIVNNSGFTGAILDVSGYFG